MSGAIEATKLFGLTAQIDVGNALVGLGTLAVAGMAFWSTRQTGRSKVNEFRKEWIENLRAHVAEFKMASSQVLLCNTKKNSAIKRW